MQAVCDELGMDMQVEDMQFDSIIAAITSGKVDVGASGFTVTEDRKKNINFTDSYITTKQDIIVKDGSSGSKIGLKEKLYDNFVKDSRYMYIVKRSWKYRSDNTFCCYAWNNPWISYSGCKDKP